MAETTGSATNLEDLLGQFLTWASGTPGWTVDEAINTFDSGRQLALSKGTCFVQMRWNTATPNTLAIYQSTAYNAATRAGLMTGDSGNGYNANNSTTEGSLTSERCVETIGNGPFSYWFYTNAAGDYLHVVVEIAADTFRHFGMGTSIEKFGDWDTMTGGAYCYGQAGVSASAGTDTGMGVLLDGAASQTVMNDRSATMRLAGAPNQAGSSVWAHVWGNRTVTEQTDTAGNARATCIGGARSGPIAGGLAWIRAGTSSGLAPTIPIAVFFIDKSTTPDHGYLLGFQPDVRAVHMRYLAPGDTFVLGADTWRVFPTIRRVEGGSPGDTDFQGWAYNTSA